MLRHIFLAAALVSLLSGCDQIPGMGEEEAKAIGGACRHALRGLEDCYALNPKANKAAVFTGWKDMDQYMRENKIEGTPSVLGKSPGAEKPAGEIETESRDAPADKKS